MPTVKYSVSAYIADGTTTDYLITWDYLDDDHITVEVDGLSNSDPTASHTFTKLNDTTVRVTDGIGGAIAAGKEIQIRRNTPITTRPISFSDGSALLAADLNKNSDYLLYSMQEALDQVDFTVQFQQEAEAFRDETEALRDATQALRTEVGDDTADADAHRIAAALSETNAATSEANSSTSEDNAAASELAAQTAETGAAASAAAALVSENAAAASEVASAASEAAAAVSEANAAGSEAGVAADAATATSKAAAAGVSEANALIYKNNAASSASNSEISAVNSANSATASANSAVQASNSENAAATSRNTASTYATNSQASAVASEASKVASGLSEAAAATSEANASSSEANAATSEANAATSEANSATSEGNAATSATASETSRVASVAAQVASETAKTASETAQTASESARDAASASESAAAASEVNAAASEASASTDAATATTKAGEASTSASNAASSAASAQASKDAALEALDSFDDRYLGQKTSDPTTDNDGNALVAGSLYFNTTDDAMKVYEGSVWVAAYASLSGALIASSNLSDLADTTASRTNLGLAIGTNVQAFSAILQNTTASYTTAEETKLAGIEANANRITNNNQLTNGAGYITVSEVPVVDATAIIKGDSSVTVSDNGSDGKVVVRVDNTDVAEFNDTHMVIPKGTTAERDPSPVVGTLRYNTTTNFFETFTISGWGAVATPPSITNITPNNFNGEAGATFTVDGAFFDPDTTAAFKGADGTEYAVATLTYVNSNQLTLTNATNLPVANEPFRVKVTNGAGLSVESIQSIDAGSVPAFTTAAGTLTSTAWTNPVSVTVNATDAENTISGYVVTEGNLPAGLSLNATTGAITGTSPEQATTTYTFTIGATDSAGNTNTRQFNIQIVNAAPVWSSPAEGSTQGLLHNEVGSITLSATDPEGEAVTYSASSLPTGLNISGNLITGTPTQVSNSGVAITASDGFATSVRNFFINIYAPSAVDDLYALYGSQHTIAGSSFIFDARSVTGTTGSITVTAYGGKGGRSSTNIGTTGANGWLLQGVVPASALAGKILCFVGASNGFDSNRGERDSGGGGGFSGIIELNPLNYTQLLTQDHIFTAGGGGGAATTQNGYSNSGLVSGTGTPMTAGAAASSKSNSGAVGYYPSLGMAGRPGNFYGGGDGGSNADGDDNFQGGGSGGCGPLPGGDPNNSSGPGMLGGNSSDTPHNYGGIHGGYGGGGSGSQGGNGGQPWRVTSSGGGGGGYIAGEAGGYTSDGNSTGGMGGSAYSKVSNWVTSSNHVGSTQGQLVLQFNP